MAKPILIFQPYGKRVQVRLGETILDFAKEIGVNVKSICGGQGVCGKCRVIIRDGKENLSPLSHAEGLFLSKEELDNGYRLACQASIVNSGTIVVEVPYESQLDRQKLLLTGLEGRVELEPSVKKITVHLRKPTLLDVESDADRLFEAVKLQKGLKPKIDYEALRVVPYVSRKSGWTVTVTLRMGQEIIWVEPGVLQDAYGFAVDIGTTKLAAYLVDLNNGKIVATASMMNPQITYGEDVISRISLIMKDEKNLDRLHDAIVGGINDLIKEACEKAGVSEEMIYDLTFVGNTAMHHIFLNIPPNYLALMPYTPVIQSPLNFKARDLGVKINRGAYIHALPNIAGFVGGDAVADVIATEIYDMESLAMTIDIGTNTEIVLGNRDGLMACSCASGPAFEGAHIKYGMRAATGAIEHVYIDPETLKVGYETIDGEKPRGLCGSAIIDVTAEMLKAGIIGTSGRINTTLKTPRLRVSGEATEFVIAWKDETSIGSDVVVTQNDIREVQLAKAAIHTGTVILMKHMKVAPHEIQKVFIAGAFGNYVDPQSARMIGMYPDVPLERVQFVGNTAGSGARMALLSTKIRSLAEKVAKRIQYVELGADSNFQKEFFMATYLPHQEVKRFPSVMRLIGEKTKDNRQLRSFRG